MSTEEHWDNTFKEGKDFTTLNEVFLDEVLAPHITEILKSETKTALDVGCGTGDTVLKLMKRGFMVKGIDVSGEAVRIAKERTSLDDNHILVGNIDDGALNQFVGETYNLITMKLVLAFMKDKKSVLCVLAKLLSKNGKLLIITPLIYPNVTYEKKRTIGISVNEVELSQILNEVFVSHELIHKDFQDDNSVIGYYLCSNNAS